MSMPKADSDLHFCYPPSHVSGRAEVVEDLVSVGEATALASQQEGKEYEHSHDKVLWAL